MLTASAGSSWLGFICLILSGFPYSYIKLVKGLPGLRFSGFRLMACAGVSALMNNYKLEPTGCFLFGVDNLGSRVYLSV